MKRISVLLLTILFMILCVSALAAKARSISSEADSAYHEEHLKRHIGESSCFATGNYIKAYNTAGGSKVTGHLEQADKFILLDIKNGQVQIEVILSDKTSPDSWIGMSGWVNADYVDCGCDSAKYFTTSYPNSISTSTLSFPFPEGMPDGWSHSSGVGAWSTEMRINQTGSFYGYFHDADMGVCGEDYPNGTLYECLFYGQFSNIHPIDQFTYSMTVSDFNVIGELNSQFIYDEILHIITPIGIDEGYTFYLYIPETPRYLVSEEHLSWLHGVVSDPISSFALCNMENGTAFVPGTQYPCADFFISSSENEFFCKANNLRIRNMPNGNLILGHLEQDDTFAVNGIVDGWANIIVLEPGNNNSDSFSGLSGWVNAEYLKKK